MADNKRMKLESLLLDFNDALEEAKSARCAVMEFLDRAYGIDVDANYDNIEDECSWCYGIDALEVDKLIEERSDTR